MSTLTRPHPRPARSRREATADGASIATAAVVALLVGWLLPLETPPTVDLAVVNPTVYEVRIEVGRAGRQGLSGVGHVTPEGEQRFLAVLDQGDAWAFRFSYGGLVAGELTISRADLARQRWRVVVPDEVGRRLAAAGFEPTP